MNGWEGGRRRAPLLGKDARRGAPGRSESFNRATISRFGSLANGGKSDGDRSVSASPRFDWLGCCAASVARWPFLGECRTTCNITMRTLSRERLSYVEIQSHCDSCALRICLWPGEVGRQDERNASHVLTFEVKFESDPKLQTSFQEDDNTTITSDGCDDRGSPYVQVHRVIPPHATMFSSSARTELLPFKPTKLATSSTQMDRRFCLGPNLHAGRGNTDGGNETKDADGQA